MKAPVARRLLREAGKLARVKSALRCYIQTRAAELRGKGCGFKREVRRRKDVKHDSPLELITQIHGSLKLQY